MAGVLHVVKAGADAGLAAATIERQLQAGQEVRVAVLDGAPPPLPARAAVYRVPDEWSYDRLLEEIFAADQVIAW